MRVGFAVATLPIFAFFGALVYVVAWAVVPDEGEKESIVEHVFNQQRKS